MSNRVSAPVTNRPRGRGVRAAAALAAPAALIAGLTAQGPAKAVGFVAPPPPITIPIIGIISAPPPYAPTPLTPGLTVVSGGVLMPPYQPPPPPPPPPPAAAVMVPPAPPAPPPPPPAKPARQDRY